MKILLLSATQQEIQPFLHKPHHVDVLIGGVGMASTIYKLTKQLHHHYDLVIQAGIAGAFENSRQHLQPADVVTVKQDCFGDLGAMENGQFTTVQEMGFSVAPEWLVNQNLLLDKLAFKQVSAITVNMIGNEAGTMQALQTKWNADIETMEGAGLHYVCGQQHAPYIQLRSISNTVGIRDKAQWHIKEAITSLNSALFDLVAALMENKYVYA